MADLDESLDFLALLDEVTEDTVSRLMHEMGPTSCALADGHALDILSICELPSADDSMTSSGQSYVSAEADDCREEHVHQEMDETDSFGGKTISRQTEEQTLPPFVLQLTPPSSGQYLMETGVAPRVQQPHRKRSRWQFSKPQREQLDAVFRKSMYPSKWKITELSVNLDVPVHTLRVWFQNRRWRLRKSKGLTGDLHTRGSRTMLPDKGEVNSNRAFRQTSPVSLSVNQQSSTLGGAATGTTPEGKLRLPPLATSTPLPSNSPSLMSSTVGSTSSLFNMLSAPTSFYGELSKGTQAYNLGVSSLVTGWGLPQTLYWPARATSTPSFPLTYSLSPWHNYGLSVLPQLYHPDWNLHEQQLYLASKSKDMSMSSTNTCLPYAKRSLAEARSSPVPPAAYYTKPPVISSAYTSPSMSLPVKDSFLEQSSHSSSSTAMLNCASPTMEQLSSRVESFSAATSVATCEDSGCPELGRSSLVPTCMTESAECTDSAQSLSVSGYLASCKAWYTPSIVSSTSPTSSAVQPVCSCGACQNSVSSSAWPSSLPYPMNSLLRPLYPGHIHPSFPTPTPFLSIPPQTTAKFGSIMSLPEVYTEPNRASLLSRENDLGDAEKESQVVNVTRTKEEDISSTSEDTV